MDNPRNSHNLNTLNNSNNSNNFNILTIDVEDYFQVENFKGIIKFSDWESYESRVESNTHKLLDMLDEAKIKATFFVLGWLAERYPHMVKEIHSRGHEIASHSYAHQRVYNQTKDEFRADLKKSKAILEDIVGEKVIGYRAPTYSITEDSLWALDILREEGFQYDSSFFPFRFQKDGLANDKLYPHKIYPATQEIPNLLGAGFRSARGEIGFERGDLSAELHNHTQHIWELPVSTIKMLGCSVPFSGGGYFRLCPYGIVRRGMRT